MRKLVWLLILLVALCSAWWAAATTQMQSTVNALLDSRRAAGWDVTLKDIGKAGFPLTLQNRLSGLSVAEPNQSIAFEAPQLDLSAPVWWPGDLSARAPVAQAAFPAGALPLVLNMRNMQADLDLHPGLSLQLEQMEARSTYLEVNGPDGLLLEAEESRLRVTQSSDAANEYNIAVLPGRITPGPLLRRVLGEAIAQPGGQPILSARMAVTFARALDRHSAVAGTLPQIDALTVENVDAAWGDVALGAEGALTFDAQGIPDGVLSLRVTNWSKLLDAGERGGFLPPSMRGQVNTMLRLLEARGGTPGGLDLDLVFAEGQMVLAGIPLGPAPRLIQP
ncbi:MULTISPECIES: DUF2125 domain-containing protein [Sulfitobacter]|jgi:hypothetical protein|uniref:DUF2125 domain-containing protein n=1 Tax=Sulfitobacter dubius TaxID=218673 RepID=A0ABY3ZGU8_9RHOB|nr:DUF2125 domain-containing protein [Sulfitobacter dubius]UOA13850.1 hypothetical protein DSM109990_00643 [Sulfitobacter dubius]WOI27650.1 DUF2125 domain-containing protein [Sulfitobacter dubius]